MSKLVFKESDFAIIFPDSCFGNNESLKEVERIAVASQAQEVFDDWLDRGVTIYGKPKDAFSCVVTTWVMYPRKGDTHKGTIVHVEDIKSKECEHKNVTIVGKSTEREHFWCLDCNKKITANKWEIVSE